MTTKMAPLPQSEFDAFARQLRHTASAVAWLNVGVQLEQDILRNIGENQNSLLATFFRQQTLCKDFARALHKPLDIIPSSLHPNDQ